MEATHPPLDLSQPRGVRELLSQTLELFRLHSGLFVSVTLLVVAPTAVLVDGVWGRQLRDGAGAHPGTGAGLVSLLLWAVVVPPLVTGLHAVIVRSIGEGTVPSVGRALRDAGPRFPVAIGAAGLYGCCVGAGLLLLVIPGIWLAVRFYFAAQAAVLDRTPLDRALTRSAELVNGHWWKTFGALAASGLAFNLPAALVQLGVHQIHETVVYVVLRTIVQAGSVSLSALFGTLLFFTLRARQDAPEALVAA